MTGSNLMFGFTGVSRPKSAEDENLLNRPNSENAAAFGSTEPALGIKDLDAEKELTRDRAWENALRQLGQELEQLREEQGLTRDQLYTLTHVPQYQIRALETGTLEKLPQDIYVRGFIRRIGDALGVDGSALAASLPERDSLKTAIGSTKPSKFSFSLSLSPMHLYVVYGVVLVTAILGLSFQKSHSASLSPSTPALSHPVDVD